MATLADQQAWDELAELFTPTVRADGSELSGQPAADVPAADLLDAWRAGLSGLSGPQHLLGNQDVLVDGDRATATAYVHAAHRLTTTFADSVWAAAGSHQYELQRTSSGGRVVVTGANRSIGHEVARQLAAAGDIVYLTAGQATAAIEAVDTLSNHVQGQGWLSRTDSTSPTGPPSNGSPPHSEIASSTPSRFFRRRGSAAAGGSCGSRSSRTRRSRAWPW
jgi:hypothetical protein